MNRLRSGPAPVRPFLYWGFEIHFGKVLPGQSQKMAFWEFLKADLQQVLWGFPAR